MLESNLQKAFFLKKQLVTLIISTFSFCCFLFETLHLILPGALCEVEN